MQQFRTILGAIVFIVIATAPGCENSDNNAIPADSAKNRQTTPNQNSNVVSVNNRSDAVSVDEIPLPISTPSLNGDYKINVICKTNPKLKIERIRITNEETIIYFVFTNTDSYPKTITTPPPGHEEAFFIMRTDKPKKFHLLDIEGIAIKPNYTSAQPNETVKFMLTFERIEDSMTRFHVIEGEVEPKDNNISWRFLNVGLK